MERKDRKAIDNRVLQAEKRLNDAILQFLEAQADLRDAYREADYHDSFQDGVEWFKSEIGIVAQANSKVEDVQIKPAGELTDSERMAQEALVTAVAQNPGMRQSDIVRKMSPLPVKPALTEDTIIGMIRRLTAEKRLTIKVGRYYAVGHRQSLPDYQVMSYLPDGSKYLGSDIQR